MEETALVAVEASASGQGHGVRGYNSHFTHRVDGWVHDKKTTAHVLLTGPWRLASSLSTLPRESRTSGF